jgi:hypothetical protein
LDTSKLQEVNVLVEALGLGEEAIIETRNSTYKVTKSNDVFYVEGGYYGNRAKMLMGAPYFNRLCSFVFHDNPMYKHYTTVTSEVNKVSIGERLIYSNGR